MFLVVHTGFIDQLKRKAKDSTNLSLTLLMIYEYMSRENYKELLSKIAFAKKIGVYDKQMEENHNEIINSHIIKTMEVINDQFIASQQWQTMHIDEVLPWELIVYDNKVCRIVEIYKHNYNPGSDTFDYLTIIKGVFLSFDKQISFGYFETILCLNLSENKTLYNKTS